MVTQLTGDGVKMDPIGMGYASQSAPLRELERLVLEGSLVHEGDPVLQWMVGNVTIQRDPRATSSWTRPRAATK